MQSKQAVFYGIKILIYFWAVCGIGVGVGIAADAPRVHIPESVYVFSPVVDGAKVSHKFVVQNKGRDILKISKIKTG